ncbi:MAG: OmpA family protein [Candidatus Sumerlaeota bacterium]|nr:OmpA family protein [Candidatus Sumerlaeota bacterium]
MKWLVVVPVVMLMLAAVIMTGCTTVQKGAAAGGVAGAVVGGIWANQTSGALNTAEGALTGAAAGGVVGALAGDQLREKREENLEADIASLKNQRDQLEEELKNLKAKAGAGGEKDQLIDALKQQTDKLNKDLDALKKQLQDKENELAGIRGVTEAKEKNLDDLKKQLDKLQVQLAQTPRGITLTIVDSLLFTPGMAEISEKGKALLDNVALILKERFPGRELIFEGHTDNQPIKYSGWKSNWELGSARSMEVLHYMVANHNFDPKRLSAVSYGEFRPVASNNTDEGRAQNRRAVIVVLPMVEITKKPLQ